MEKKKNIVLVSDNHGLEEPIRFLQNRYASYDYFFHCGDYTLPKEVMKGFAVVRGNNDYRDEFPLHRTIHVGNHTFLLTHGYMDMFMGRYEMLADLARKQGCDVVCFGHTHIPFQKEMKGILLLNPGSIWNNRDGSAPSYMTLEVGDTIEVQLHRYVPEWARK